MASRRESRAYSTGLNTLQEFENLRKTFKASNDRLAKKNNELLGQITALNKQLQESAEENFTLRGALSALQRKTNIDQARFAAFERERLTMLDLLDETTRANDWARKNLTSLRRTFDVIETAEPPPPATAAPPKAARSRPSVPSAAPVSKAPEMDLIYEGESEEEPHISPRASRMPKTSKPSSSSSRVALSGSSASTRSKLDSLAIPSESQTPLVASRRPIRRQSGLLPQVDVDAGPSSSPSIIRESTKEEYNDEFATVTKESDPLASLTTNLPILSSHPTRIKEKHKRKLVSEEPELLEKSPEVVPDSRQQHLHDLTNSPPPLRVTERRSRRAGLVPVDEIDGRGSPPPLRTVTERRVRKLTGSLLEEELNSDVGGETSAAGAKPRRTYKEVDEIAPSKLMPPVTARRSRSPLPPELPSTPAPASSAAEGGRERRVRKSVNYAEPKLNTKMRKPDGYESSSKARLSASTSAAPSSSASPPPEAALTRKRRITTDVPPHPRTSSSPLADTDEPKPVRDKDRERHRAIVVEDDDDAEAGETNGDEGPHDVDGGLWHNTARLANRNSIGTAVKPKRSLGFDTNPGYPVITAVPTTMARKRKAPSYSVTDDGPGTLKSDEEGEDEDAEGYEDDNDDEFKLPTSVSARRKSMGRASVGRVGSGTRKY